MKIAIASGKGGAGKTTLATVLTTVATRAGRDVVYADCDVEAPNGHLLLNPETESRLPVTRPIPVVDLDVCKRCGSCELACQFGAILCLDQTVQVNPVLCKSCGACVAACPRRAINEAPHVAGYVETGHAGAARWVQGELNVGEARCIPVIDAVRAAASGAGDLVILDAPPGAACPMVAVVRDVDLVVLVAEATAFGLADLTIAADAVKALGLPTAVVINRSNLGDRRTHAFCEKRGLPILAEIPDLPELSRAYAQGDLDRIIALLDRVPRRLLDALDAWPTRRAS